MTTLQRQFTKDLIDAVCKHRLYLAAKQGIDDGAILPCLRKQEVHLYEGGARILKFDKKGAAFTHAQYACQIGKRDIKLSDDDVKRIEMIRCAAVEHRKKDKKNELAAVHGLFKEFAITRKAYHAGELALIDVETRFGMGQEGSDLKQTMIDLAFLLPDRRILFVEAKCMGNPAIASSNSDFAGVVEQVRKYERQIVETGVLKAMNRSLDAQSELIGRKLGHAEDIVRRVPVLILNPAGTKISSGNRWLKQAIENAPNWTPCSKDIGIIDGRKSPADAIRNFAARIASR